MSRMLDVPLRKVAQTVLKKFGTDVTIRRVTGTAYSTASRSMTPTTADTTIKGRLEEYRDRDLSDRIHAGDRQLTIAAADLSFAPTEADRAVISTVVYDVLHVDTLMATDLGAIFVLQLRR